MDGSKCSVLNQGQSVNGKQEDENRKENNEREKVVFRNGFHWSLHDWVSLIESHLSKTSFLNLQLLPTLTPGRFPFFTKRLMVRTFSFKYSAASCGVMISFMRINPFQKVLFHLEIFIHPLSKNLLI